MRKLNGNSRQRSIHLKLLFKHLEKFQYLSIIGNIFNINAILSDLRILVFILTRGLEIFIFNYISFLIAIQESNSPRLTSLTTTT